MTITRNPISQTIARFQKAPPIKVIALAHELGLKVYTSSLGPNVSGMIKKDGRGGSSGYAIFANSGHAETRRRFTIAHEVAHYILHRDLIGDGIIEDALLRAEGLNNSLERQANSMAANILMPWHLIDGARETGTTTIEGLATLFNVSRDAMSYRVLGVPYAEARTAELPQL